MKNTKIKSIEQYGRLYINQYLRDQIANKKSYHDNWYEGLKFFFSKAFYRGRKDELSKKFMNAAIKTLEEVQLNKNYDLDDIELKLRENGVNNGADRKMVIEIIDFCFNQLGEYENNIVKYTVDNIKKGKISDVFNQLDLIFAIGDKIASFYIRDIVFVYELGKYLTDCNDFYYCQPVDTWVKQVAEKIHIIEDLGVSNVEAKKEIILSCQDNNIDPLLFNAGAWMVGANSFELLLEKM